MLKRLYMIVQALDSNFVIEDEIIASINSSENFK
jgi:regulator of sigma D